MDHGQTLMRGHELQNTLKLIWRIGVHLGGHAHLREAETCEFQQRIVSCNTLLEQGVNSPRPLLGRGPLCVDTVKLLSGTIHGHHSATLSSTFGSDL
jgi:hypothetical protein